MTGGMAIPTTVMVVVGMSEADRIVHKQAPTMRPVIGGFLLGFGLYAVASVNPHLATMLGILIVVSSFLTHGVTVFESLNGKKP